jgi:excisionase family DNA binding protein
MTRMFCTLTEAAQTLHANEDQIETLLEKGVLREFREGPHRLLKESDVDSLAVRLKRRSKAARQSAAQDPAQQPSQARANRPKTPPPATKPQRPRRVPKREGTPSGTRPGPRSAAPTRVSQPSVPSHTGIDNRPPERQSVRQWLWTGLVQDRPAAIALLSGLVLLTLSALVAALCALAETL